MFKYDAVNDPTHPDSTLQPRHSGDILFRLVRRFGPARGLRLFGYMMALAQGGEVSEVVNRHRIWEYVQDLKSCGLAPQDIVPSEMGPWTRSWFKAGFDIGMVLGELSNPTPAGDTKVVTSD